MQRVSLRPYVMWVGMCLRAKKKTVDTQQMSINIPGNPSNQWKLTDWHVNETMKKRKTHTHTRAWHWRRNEMMSIILFVWQSGKNDYIRWKQSATASVYTHYLATFDKTQKKKNNLDTIRCFTFNVVCASVCLCNHDECLSNCYRNN